MKRPAGNQGISKVITLIVGVVVIMLIAGCEEQNLSGTKKARLVAAENIQLKKELEQRDKQIEKQKELVAKCQQENKDLQQQAQKNMRTLMDDIFNQVIEENKKLKAQIEQLKKAN